MRINRERHLRLNTSRLAVLSLIQFGFFRRPSWLEVSLCGPSRGTENRLARSHVLFRSTEPTKHDDSMPAATRAY